MIQGVHSLYCLTFLLSRTPASLSQTASLCLPFPPRSIHLFCRKKLAEAVLASFIAHYSSQTYGGADFCARSSILTLHFDRHNRSHINFEVKLTLTETFPRYLPVMSLYNRGMSVLRIPCGYNWFLHLF